MSNIDALRKEYARGELDLADTPSDPIVQFERWFEEALRAEVPEPNAMTLSTASPAGRPSARIVLLKGLENGAFLFYTNYQSHKGRELSENPHAALTFLWHELQRQVRVEGRVERLSPEASTEYFQSRPKSSQIGAWVSPQSQPIESRKVLEKREQELWEKYEDAEQLPRPEHWGGFRVVPQRIEFWQGRPSRLHDRIFFERDASGEWRKSRLAP
ncbi:MAG: pyridoxamine 5'-phosphate oxidase [Bacteroidetes bacterium]|nr:pyridoxamine 5'-phosphate oxidase [Bacteroidota bacterium]